jgi:hypothetical protein
MDFILQKNLNQMNINFASGVDALDYLRESNMTFDLLYLDPARRDLGGSKVFRFAHCEPDITKHLDELLQYSQHILIKSSPIHDISLGLKELHSVSDVYVVSINNECKEILFLIKKNNQKTPNIHAVMLCNESNVKFSFQQVQEQEATLQLGLPSRYLFEPDASFMKAGAFKLLAKNFQLKKLHQHTHLYTSEQDCPQFPGRRFVIEHCCKVDKKTIHSLLVDGKANLSIRNFPNDTKTLKKKLALHDGGNQYVFAATIMNEDKILLVTKQC